MNRTAMQRTQTPRPAFDAAAAASSLEKGPSPHLSLDSRITHNLTFRFALQPSKPSWTPFTVLPQLRGRSRRCTARPRRQLPPQVPGEPPPPAGPLTKVRLARSDLQYSQLLTDARSSRRHGERPGLCQGRPCQSRQGRRPVTVTSSASPVVVIQLPTLA